MTTSSTTTTAASSLPAMPWLAGPLSDFCQYKQTGKLGHALLVGVHQGEGGELLLPQLAQAALCTHVSENGACQLCKPCQLFEAGTHPDLYTVKADGNQIKVDQVRELCEKLTKTAQQG